MPNPDPFFQYPVHTFKTSEGPFDLPMFFYDASLCMALFLCDIKAANAITEPEDLEAVDFGNGQALVGLGNYDYRKATVDPYLEVGLVIAAVPKGSQHPADPIAAMLSPTDMTPMGFYVVDLPVTTEQARSGGIELWGFPKFVGKITHKQDGDSFEGSTADPDTGEPIYTLSGKAGIGTHVPTAQGVYYTRKDGKTLRCLGTTRGIAKFSLPGTMKLSVSGTSQHRMAKNMQALGLDGATPISVIMCPKIEIRLTEGAAVS